MGHNWQQERPSSQDRGIDIPQIVGENFGKIDEILNVSHYSFTKAGTSTVEPLSGHHKDGGVGVIYIGTQTQIGALTSPISGGLALATDGGGLEAYSSGAWCQIGDFTWPRMRAYLSVTIPMSTVSTTGIQTEQVIFDTEDSDTLSAYNVATGTFTVTADGPYVIIASLCLCGTASSAISLTADPAEEEWHTDFSSPMVCATINPSADQDVHWVLGGDATYHWEALANDTDTDKVCSSPGVLNEIEYLGLDMSSVPGSSVKTSAGLINDIASVTLCAKNARKSGSGVTRFALGLGVNASWYWCPALSASDSWSWDYYTWTANPETSAAWGGKELDGTDATAPLCGLGLKTTTVPANGFTQITRLKAIIKYRLKNFVLVKDDDDTTYITDPVTSTAPPTGGFCTCMDEFQRSLSSVTLSSGAAYPFSMPVSSVTMYLRISSETSANKIKPFLDISGTLYNQEVTTYKDGTFHDYTVSWDNNPATSASWTTDQINGVGSNVLSGWGYGLTTYACAGSGYGIQITKARTYVIWKLVAPTVKLLVQKGGVDYIATHKTFQVVESEIDETINLLHIGWLTAGQELTFYVVKTNFDDIVTNTSSGSFVSIHRVSGRCF